METAKPQVKVTHYQDTTYLSKGRLSSYWHQIDEIHKLNPAQLLEIGVGNGFLRRELSYILDTTIFTLDIASDLSPDTIADVRYLPVLDNGVDVSVAFQVLEHLSYDDFETCLLELKRVSRSHVVISLPDRTPCYHISLALPLIPAFRTYWSPSVAFSPSLENPSHFWEIGLKGYPLSRIKNSIKASGLRIIKTYRVFEHCYHRFFLLEVVHG